MNTRSDGALAAVTGASGFIGEALVLHLLAGGRRVRALVRGPGAASERLRLLGCEIVAGDLDDLRALEALADGAAEVYHCAATLAKTDKELSRRVNVAGTEHVARASLLAGVRRVLYVSSGSVYAASRRADNTYAESVEPEHTASLNNYSRTKWEGECVVRRLAEAEGLRFTIIRPTNVYGLRSRPWFRQWESLLARVPVAFGSVPLDFVYVKDVVAAFVAAAASPAAENEVFNVGHEMIPMREFVAGVGRVTGRRARMLPPAIDRGVCVAADRGFRIATGSQMSPSLVRPAYFPQARARAAFGYSPQYRLLDAIVEMTRDYRAAAA